MRTSPVVSSDADSSNRGSTAGVGISFDESGYAAGDLVADVLLGAKPSTIPFERDCHRSSWTEFFCRQKFEPQDFRPIVEANQMSFTVSVHERTVRQRSLLYNL